MKTSLSFKYYLLAVSFLLIFNHSVFAEQISEHTKVWTSVQLTGSITIDKKWNYYLEPQLRFLDDKYKFNHANLYFGLYYQYIPTISFWLGGFRGYTLQSNNVSQQQYKLWEQVVWNIMENPRLKLINRTRLEERKNFIHSQIANRIREKISIVLPIKNHEPFFLVFADEIFIQLNQPSWVVDRTFSQNQASIGIRIPINKQSFYEIGYLNQFQYGSPNQLSNVLYLNFATNLDRT